MATRVAKPKPKRQAKKPASDQPPLLTEKQIEKRYPNQWVLLLDLVERPGPVLLKARVAGHSTKQQEILELLDELKPRNFGMFHTGRMKGNYLL